MLLKRICTAFVVAVTSCIAATAQGNRFVFPDSVGPLLTSAWGQEYPYNRKCPTVVIDSTEKHVYAGCGPLVMSQVMRRYGMPAKSGIIGRRYDWKLMPDRSTDTTGLAAQDAVAWLIRDCGTAAGTNYTSTASSTKLNSVVIGLKRHFGYNTYMHIADRAYYTGKAGDYAWKTLIYNELKAGRPVIIRGEKTKWNAHVFIIDGCRDSTVHVNWGWGGRRNGYYDPDSLYGYTKSQRMVVGVTPKNTRPVTKRINVETPGRLAAQLSESDWQTMRSVKVTGALNKDDIRTLRQLAGSPLKTANGGKARTGCLAIVDMSESAILTLPDSAFYGCDNLTYISLPMTLPEVSNSAFAGCSKLNTVRIHPAVYEIKPRAFSGCFNLIDVSFPRSLRIIGANAFNSCNSLSEVTLPPNVTTIGSGAFANATSLRRLTIPKTAKTGSNIAKGTKVKQIKRL